MKFKKIMFVSILLLAILTLGAVSASGDADNLAAAGGDDFDIGTPLDDEILSLENTATAVGDGNFTDGGEEPEVNDGDDNFTDFGDSNFTDEDDTGSVDSWLNSDKIYTDSIENLVSVSVPNNCDGTISIEVNGTEKGRWVIEHYDEVTDSYYGWKLSDLQINDAGDYTITVKLDGEIINSENITVYEFNYDAKDNGTFTALQEKINDAGKGSTVTLDDDYAYDDGFAAGEISIGKSLTVDGKGHIIDCKNKSRAFNLDADGITLKNIIFKNGQSAIYSLWDNNIGIMNCSFINCSASSDDPFGISGGIIHLSGSNCIISESNFIGCSVSANGYVEGGIVCIRGSNSTISESNFIGCSVSANEYVDGGIIYFRGNNNAITNSEFIDSSISSSNDYIRGGAVSFRGLNNKVFKSRFINSRTSAHGMGYVDGGVIEFFDGEDNIISDSVFADCKLESSYYINGGVVSAFGSNINVTRSNFTGCFAKSSGGCIDFAGGVIYIRGGTYSNITESRFINCLSSLSNCPKEERFCIGGGVIYTAWTSDCIVSKSSFIGCTVQIDSSTYANGGAVYFDSGVENMISDSRFENCSLKGTSPHVSSLVTSSDDLSAYKVCDSSFDGCGGYNILIDAKYKNCTIRNCPTVKIVGISVKNLNVVYGSGVKCMITVSENYAPAKDVSVVVSINGKKFTTIKTDSKGVASFKISQAPGTYKLTLTASGKSVSKTMTVKKATPKLTANAKSFKKSVKTKKYTVTLKTNQNKVMKNTKVTLKVNGKTYSAKTNAKGQATFKITKLTKKGEYTAVVKFAGNMYYNAKTAKPKITVK